MHTPSSRNQRALSLAALTMSMALATGVLPAAQAEETAPAGGAENATEQAPLLKSASEAESQETTTDEAKLSEKSVLDEEALQKAIAESKDSTELVTVIVQLEDNNLGVPWYKRIFGMSEEKRHDVIEDRIDEVVSESDNEQDDAEKIADYYNALDGFAIKVPANLLEDIQNLEGVKTAFIENVQTVPVPVNPVVTDQDGETSTAAATSSVSLAAQSKSNITANAMAQIDKTTQDGEGQVIAIIDSGLDVNHDAFKGDVPDDTLEYTESEINNLKKNLATGSAGTYTSEKVVFSYDYADRDADVVPHSGIDLSHGTHVAGIAAGNGGDIEGAAPDAQIMALKIAADFDGSIRDANLLAALDDVAKLKPDVVNLSLGTDAGMSTPAGSVFSEVYANLEAQGISVNAASGNSYSAASGNTSGKSLPYASDPDSSNVSSPASYSSVFAIASVDNAIGLPYIESADGRKILYQQANHAEGLEVAQFSDVPNGNYKYFDAGVGTFDDAMKMSDTHGSDALNEGIVLVKRGGEENGETLTFQKKIENIQIFARPKAIIIYDNTNNTSLVTPGITETATPVAMISREDGEALLAATDKTLKVEQGLFADATTTYSASDFSSWGVTPDLKLKPEIAGVGGNVYSATPNNTYGNMSGTSMATPQMAGISALIRERVEKDSNFAGLSAQERQDVVNQLLMSTSVPLANPQAEDGAFYSPRKQGSGFVNSYGASTSNVYLTVDGAEENRVKADLGDGTGGWSFTFKLHNVGDKAQSYTLDSQALSEQVADGLFQEVSKNWAGQGITVSYGGDATAQGSGAEVSVDAHGTAEVTVSISIDQAFADFAQANTPNGTFVDGFTLLKAKDGQPDLSLPFVGFYGDWGKVPVFDAKLSEGGEHIYGSTIANSNNGVPLGVNPLDTNAATAFATDPAKYIDEKKFVASQAAWSAAPNSIQPVTGTLRTAETLTYSYTNAAGKEVLSYTYDGASKSLYSQTNGQVLYAEAYLDSAPVFKGLDAQGNLLPEGKYTLTIKAKTAGPSSSEQSISYDFMYDLTGPVISNLQTVERNGEKFIEFDATDNSYISAVDLHDPETGGWFYRVLATDHPEPDANGMRTYHFSMSVAEAEKGWKDMGGEGDMPATVPLYAWDYGLNSSAKSTAVIKSIPMEKIELSSSSLSLVPGQNSSLSATYTPESATETELVWESSDPSVVTVDSQGKLHALAEGNATITVSSKYAPEVKATATISVAAVAADAGLMLSDSDLLVATDGEASISALLSADLQGSQVTWSSSNTELFTITPDANGTTAVLKAGSRSGSATITATVTKNGKTYTATANIMVRQADYADFITDGNGKLIRYVGAASYVNIPEDITSIGEEAFRGKTMETIYVPASVTSIGDRAFADASRLTKVTFEDSAENPSQLKTVGASIIDNNLKFDELFLPSKVETLGDSVFANSTIKRASIPDTVTVIPSNAFSRSAQLYDLTIGDKVTEIGDNAFVQTSLTELKIRQADGSTISGLPSQLVKIGGSAFVGTGIPSFTLPSGVRSIGDAAFSSSAITSIALNDGLESIGANAFSGSSVTELTVPDSVTTVGRSAFGQMGSLKKLHLGDQVANLVTPISLSPSLLEVTVDDDALNYKSVDGVLLTKDGTHLVGYPAAKNAGGNYTIPDGVVHVDDEAFWNVPLTSVGFSETLKTIGRYGFAGAHLTSFKLPDSFETIGGSAFQGMPNLREVDLGGTIKISGYAFDSDTSLTKVNMREDLNRLVEIGDGAFGTVPFEVLRFPDSLTTIGSGAFANNGALKEVHIGAGLTKLEDMLFTGSNNLSVLTVSPNNPVYSADQNVLYAQQDDGLHLVLSLPTNTFTEYTVKPGTVQIDKQAFRNVKNLKKVNLPEGLKRIEVGAFNNVGTLTEINFPDSLEYVDGFYSTGLTLADFSRNIRSIKENSFMGAMPEHIVVRGGVDGSFDSSMDFESTILQTGYFGEGMTHVGYGYGMIPKILVLPASLKTFEFSTYDMANGTSDVVFYVADKEGSDAWNLVSQTMTKEGLNPATQLKEYTPLTAKASVDEGEIAAGETVKVLANISGGVDGGKEVRFVQVAPDGTRTPVTEWTAASKTESKAAAVTDTYSAAFDWKVPADSTSLVAEVRDLTYYSVEATLALTSAPALTQDLPTDEQVFTLGDALPTLTVAADLPAGADSLSYQWYQDGTAINGATDTSYTPEITAAGTHTYYVVVTAHQGNATARTTSSTATYKVVEKQPDPVVPTPVPTPVEPTPAPSPTVPAPTVEPSVSPTADPTVVPTADPTVAPTAEPSVSPTAEPSASPTADPTVVPTAEPSVSPTADPTVAPTVEPSATPSSSATAEPSASATAEPSASSTAQPSAEPSASITVQPTPISGVTSDPATIPTVATTVTPDPAVPTATAEGTAEGNSGSTGGTTASGGQPGTAESPVAQESAAQNQQYLARTGATVGGTTLVALALIGAGVVLRRRKA